MHRKLDTDFTENTDQKINHNKKRFSLTAWLGWTRTSYALMSTFLAVILLIMVVWWPLVVDYFSTADPRLPLWQQLDGLLLGIFAVMSLLIMAGADLKKDAWIVLVGLAGGLAIESWGTQTHIWTYFTLERPPLWIIPAWPIASLSIDRLVRILQKGLPKRVLDAPRLFNILYWLIFPVFYLLMLVFVWPTLDKSLTWLALLACALMILSPTDQRFAVLTFIAGSSLGYFLERWGTTRECWTYYTYQTPPLFAVLAHGLASVAFWRAGLIIKQIAGKVFRLQPARRPETSHTVGCSETSHPARCSEASQTV
jgi:hypothetical protein